jgi:hypothetical protein
VRSTVTRSRAASPAQQHGGGVNTQFAEDLGQDHGERLVKPASLEDRPIHRVQGLQPRQPLLGVRQRRYRPHDERVGPHGKTTAVTWPDAVMTGYPKFSPGRPVMRPIWNSPAAKSRVSRARWK